MPSLPSKLSPRRSLRRLQTAFSPSHSSDSSSPTGSSPTSAIDFRGLDKMLDPSVTNLILTNIDENGSWAHSGTTALSPSVSNLSTSPASPARAWKLDTWTAPAEAEPRRLIRKKKSKVELLQVEEKQQIRGDLLGMVEPRPGTGIAKGGIEEVLQGEA